MSADTICVVGAGGLVGQRVAGELARANARFSLVGRRAAELEELGGGTIHIADALDAAALAKALVGARVVINCASPLRETAAPVLGAAMAAGASYIDVGGEQNVMHALYQEH